MALLQKGSLNEQNSVLEVLYCKALQLTWNVFFFYTDGLNMIAISEALTCTVGVRLSKRTKNKCGKYLVKP